MSAKWPKLVYKGEASQVSRDKVIFEVVNIISVPKSPYAISTLQHWHVSAMCAVIGQLHHSFQVVMRTSMLLQPASKMWASCIGCAFLCKWDDDQQAYF